MAGRRGFGHLRKLPSGRYQASYVAPDTLRVLAPTTFQTKKDAETWLALRQAEIADGTWRPPRRRGASTTFGEFAQRWLELRTSGALGKAPMKPTTGALYERLMRRQLAPLLPLPLAAITEDCVTDWYEELNPAKPTTRAHAYALVRTVMTYAVDRKLIPANPCRIRGAGQATRATRTEPATIEELTTIMAAMPPNLRALVLLTCWCALRFGEATELRRRDVHLGRGYLDITRAVSRVKGVQIVQTPKSGAGIRRVHVPPHVLPILTEHLAEHVGTSPDELVFPGPDGNHLPHSSLLWHWHRARDAAGRPDLRFHDLRHTGAVLAAATGATLAELMARLGHSTPAAAMRYQHAARDADSRIAQALSALAGGS